MGNRQWQPSLLIAAVSIPLYFLKYINSKIILESFLPGKYSVTVTQCYWNLQCMSRRGLKYLQTFLNTNALQQGSRDVTRITYQVHSGSVIFFFSLPTFPTQAWVSRLKLGFFLPFMSKAKYIQVNNASTALFPRLNASKLVTIRKFAHVKFLTHCLSGILSGSPMTNSCATSFLLS